MSTAYANSDFSSVDEEFSLKKFLVYSGALHATVFLAIAASIYFQFRGNQWAGEGGDLGGTKVNLVSSAGIPMPRPIIPTQSQVVDPTQGLHEIEPPKLEQTPPDVTKLPEFKHDKPLPPSRKSKVFENKIPPPTNAIPYGKGGNPDIPTGYSQNPGASAGVAMQGQGGGDFASRYGWYVAAVRRRIDPNHDPMSIDAAVRYSKTLHCSVSFTVARDGSIHNARITESSGNQSWDNAGLRAIIASNPLPALPNDYSGTSVDVIWDFPERTR
jgi:periplasmic protein TonB